MSRYTRLEAAAMDALVHDLRMEIPDLAGQFEESRPSQRRNSGFGLFTEMIVDRGRPAPTSGPTGDLGTVHVMVGSLPDPIAFKARVRHGVLLGLMGDSYGQDTRAINFATVAFDQVFTVDAEGRSIPFEPARQMPRSSLLGHRNEGHARIDFPLEPPSLRSTGAVQRVQEVDTPPRPKPNAVLGKILQSSPAPEVSVPKDQTTILVGLWGLIGLVAVVLVIVVGVPLPGAIIFAVVAGRAAKQPMVLNAVRKAMDNWQASQVTGKD